MSLAVARCPGPGGAGTPPRLACLHSRDSGPGRRAWVMAARGAAAPRRLSDMADFRAFTIAAGVTAIVLGAGIGAALGALSSPQPPLTRNHRAPMSTATARSAARPGPAMGDGTMDR